MAKLDNKEQVLKKALADKDSIQEVGLALEKDATTSVRPKVDFSPSADCRRIGKKPNHR